MPRVAFRPQQDVRASPPSGVETVIGGGRSPSGRLLRVGLKQWLVVPERTGIAQGHRSHHFVGNDVLYSGCSE